MTYRYLAFLAFFISITTLTRAQNQGIVFAEDSTIKVYAYGQQRQLAWCGGFNNPEFATADLNHDGINDLVVFEWGTNQIKTFLNTSISGTAHYIYAPKYALNFPDINSYLILADYNRDGVMDLIEHGSQGFQLFKGFYNSANELSFTLYKILRFNSPAFGNLNAYSQNSDIAGVADVDHDGDLDFFGYNETGFIIYYYKNCQVENGLPKDSVQVCLPSNCWGAMAQGFNPSFSLGITCGTLGTFSCRQVNSNKVTMHSGNALCVFDYDGDGDFDLLDGNISFSTIQFLKNGKAQYGGRDSMVSQDTTWQSGGVPVNMPYWPAAFNVDADGDGKKDLLIAPHAQSVSEDYKCIAFYKNTGTAASPIFTYQSDTFLIDHAVDAGTGAFPMAYDYNKDGRPDLFVGSKGYYSSSGTPRSRISYYQNTLVGGETRLVLQSNDFLNIGSQNYYGAAPAFGDLDNDGVDDMVIGHEDGTLSFYKNTAASNSVTPQWVLFQQMLKSVANDTINVGYSAVPFIYDINKDGKPDLLIGQNNGNVYYYQNTGTAGLLKLQKVTTKLGNMVANPANLLDGNSTLYIGKMDNTGKDYLLMGNGEGMVLRYDGFQSGNVTIPYNQIDTAYSFIDAGANSALTVADFNGDGKYEMIIGNELGGLNLYRQVKDVSVSVRNVYGSSEHCTLFPNPATHAIYLTWDRQFSGSDAVQVQVMNMTGQVVYDTHMNGSALNGAVPVAQLANGVYMCLARSNGQVFASRFIVSR